MTYCLCKHCDHFIERNPSHGDTTVALYIHLDDGEKEHDHDAEPGPMPPKEGWMRTRPDLFRLHRDGKIGPNSRYHKPPAR